MNDDRLSRIETKLDTVQAGLAELGVGQEELRRHMDVLHEDVLNRIKGATLDPQVVDDRIQRGDNAVRAEMTERLAPIETAIRALKMP